MAIRITQPLMYGNMVGHMQSSLSNYMQSVEQSGTQKRINRPSDDPAGAYRVLMTRDDISSTSQLMDNIKTAKGWLQLEDGVLSTEVSTVITRLKELAEQASTGTYNADNRQQIAFEVREQFGNLLNLANTRYEGRSVFAGHQYDESAFDMGLALTSWDDDWAKAISEGQYEATGDTSKSVVVQFMEDGKKLSDSPAFKYTKDGGKTWENGTVQTKIETLPDKTQRTYYELDFGGSVVKVSEDMTVKVNSLKEEDWGDADNGSVLYVRPTAVYNGDDNDPPVQMTILGSPNATASVDGEFKTNVLVRMDTDVNLTNLGDEFQWSYSTDGGANWVTARGTTNGNSTIRLPVPGGFMDITQNGNAPLQSGTQILAKPDRADLGYEIYDNTYLAVNGVGKDIFGGYYKGKPALEGADNLFEVVGAFIGYLENNNQEGCQRTLAALATAQEHILTEATRIGGKEHRLEVALNVMTTRMADQKEQLSMVEDIDLTELVTKLAQQQLTYQNVLKASSNIMNLSLASYV